MSQQSTSLEASSLGVDLVRGIKTAIARVAGTFHTRRQAHARRIDRSIVVRYSDQDLAGCGWSAEDIRRLKSQ